MMAKYAISAHGACALRILADNILLRSMDTERAGWQLKTSFDSYNDKIGTYADDISLIIEQEKCFLRNSTRLANDIKKLSAEIETLVKQNDCPQEVIANMVKEPNILDIYFVIDTSESMKSTLEAVNPAIEEIIPELKDISEYTNVDIRLNILAFSLAAQWYNKEPSSISSFEWKYLESGGAAANVGEAFVKLEERLSSIEYTKEEYYAPIIFFITKAKPYNDYSFGMNKLKTNPIFIKSKKIAVPIGEADMSVVINFIAGSNKIISCCSPEYLKKNISFELM